ncbi:AI-2E family transporter [Streptomyces sp. NP160]|uniref:AI-2E family transporter n=1 Tax=Streptomyces sp. NP160 TaxID=2586637 RepID=UPI001118DF39|nr:AI-2E family transporter [Streptomyces sp. NP160]TNM67359.1 AI-2E family transporter [Streptomyces sp. NP160]
MAASVDGEGPERRPGRGRGSRRAQEPPPRPEEEAPAREGASEREVVEPPVLAPPPTSPWADGLGRTATRCLQLLLVVVAGVVVVYACLQLRLVVVPLLLSALVAAAAAPLVRWLVSRGLGRGLATGVVLLAGAAVLAAVGWAVVGGVRGQWPQLQASAQEGFAEVQRFVVQGGLPVSDAQVAQARDAAVGVLTGAGFRSGALAGLGVVTQIATGTVLALFLLFYFLKDGPRIWSFLISGVHGPRHRRLERVGERSAVVLGGYVRGTATVALVDAVLIGVGVAVVGVPLALPIALLTFVAAFVPIVGAVAAGVVAALVALVTVGPVAALVVVGIVVVVNQVEGNLLQPVLLGRALSLHPLAILLALTAGTVLGGVVGAVLSVPLAAVAWAAVVTWNAEKRTSAAATTQQPRAEGQTAA